MDIEKITKKELERDSKTLGKIFLHFDKDGSWFRAYNWSAYLARFFYSGLTEKERLKACIEHESGNTYTKVGLQEQSFHKYFPNANIIKNENVWIIEVDLSKYEKEITLSNYLNLYKEWESTVKPRNKSKKNPNTNVYNSPASFSNIMRSIIRFNPRNKTDVELEEYIYELKDLCAALI